MVHIALADGARPVFHCPERHLAHRAQEGVANAIEHAQNTWATAAPMSGARHVDRAHPFTGRLQRREPLLIGAGRGGDPAGSQTGFGKQRLVSGVELWPAAICPATAGLSAAATIVCTADRAAGVSTMRCAYRSTRSCAPIRDDSVGAYVAQQAGTHQFLPDLPHFVGNLARSLTDADQCHCAPNSGETPIHNGSRTFASAVSILLGRCGERCSKSAHRSSGVSAHHGASK